MQESIFEGVHQRGVGAILGVNASTRALNKFFGNLPANYGQPIDQVDAHVTLIDSNETIIDVFSERDLITLRNAGMRMIDYLGSLPLTEMVLNTSGERLEKFGRYLGIVIASQSFLEDTRGHLAEIIYDEVGVKVKNSEYIAHMSVTKVGPGRKKIPKYVPPIPPRLHINGFSVGQRIFASNQNRLRSSQKYINKTISQLQTG